MSDWLSAMLPEEFESDYDRLIETSAHEAQARWRDLTAKYEIESEAAVDPQVEIAALVRAQLTPIAEGLNREAWSKDKERLESDCRLGADSLDKVIPADVPISSRPVESSRRERRGSGRTRSLCTRRW